ncbi:hypothetical protein F9L33_13950 [Amylibacter sp. SFDW26]|uniref:hypothetical protein n=1 Tax=Amylibacter sp. SFDW26 TaxID=2652722 RepID=UPI00126222AE|nr:hypothetical protein [Amylibacter sp. SFDW26]KAB7610400.1 hypothetical protein F9L33_13950 [Amylibacter sp. SFDW26]
MRYLTSLCVLSLISGCAVPALELNAPVTARVAKQPTNSFRNSPVILRSYKVNDEGKKVEFSGAQCSGRNAFVSFSKASTPANIQLPTYLQGERFANRGKPPALKVSCKYGKTENKFILEPTSAVGNVTVSSGTQYNYQTGVYSNPSVTHLTGRLSPTLPWRYSSATVDF